jgi:hypothetical protein
MSRSVLSLRVDPRRPVQRPFQPVTILVDGEDLIDLVAPLELPFAEEERRMASLRGEEPLELGDLVGRYANLSAASTFLPSRNFLGHPYDTGLLLPPDDPYRDKSALLGCGCGVTECWLLMARIEVHADVVTWTDFGQLHRRHWGYGLSFEFEREAYERELRGPS